MDESLLSEFEQLKISALSKLKFVKSDIGQVTLGPNSVQNKKPIGSLEKTLQVANVPKLVRQNNNNNDIQNILRNNETLRMKEVRNIIQSHIDSMEKFSIHNQLYHQKKWLAAQEEFIKCQKQKELQILEANDEFDRTLSIERERAEKQYQQMEEQRKLRQQELKVAEEQKKMLHLNIEKIKKYHQEFRMVYQTITGIIQKCLNKEKLREKLGSSYEQLKNLPNQIEEIRLKCKNSSVDEEDVKRGLDILTSIKNLDNKIQEIVEEISVNIETRQKMVLPESSTVSTETRQQTTVEQEPPPDIETRTGTNTTDSSRSDQTFSMSNYISANNFKLYCEIMTFLESYSENFQELEQDVTQKQFKFDCKKAVNIPVNALSGVSPEHIFDKYKRLYSLLKGLNIEVNNKIVNASTHHQGIPFCMNLLAKKLVLQGDLMVSSNPESAFCYASLINSLWNEIPSFGKLVLAYFYTACPSLVPYHIPRQVGETDEQFYKKCGYHYIDGQIESQDKFLKRITGIARLYFALLIAKPKHNQNKIPHNLSNGWRWLTSTLKLEPQVDVTATMLHTFLETVGFEMEAKYGNMFLKLLLLISGNFLQICKENCTGGAGTRLELLLNQYMQKKTFSQPPGYTAVSRW